MKRCKHMIVNPDKVLFAAMLRDLDHVEKLIRLNAPTVIIIHAAMHLPTRLFGNSSSRLLRYWTWYQLTYWLGWHWTSFRFYWHERVMRRSKVDAERRVWGFADGDFDEEEFEREEWPEEIGR